MIEERKKISQVWKVGRLLIGKTQQEMARDLNISQASISMIESMNAEPSASDWYRFCQLVGIDAHKTIELGYIDGRTVFNGKLYEKAAFKIPKKYKTNNLLKVRELIPFMDCIVKELGPHEWQAFLIEHKIDPEVFFVYDFEVSLALFNDVSFWGRKRGLNLLESAQKYVPGIQPWAMDKEEMSVSRRPSEFLRVWADGQYYYHKVFAPQVNPLGNAFKVTLNEIHKALSLFDRPTVMDFVKYKVNGFQETLTRNLGPSHQLDIIYRNDEISFLLGV